MTAPYPNTKLYIAGNWVDAIGGETIDVMNPVTGKPIEMLHMLELQISTLH